ncbi:MAG: hypothetical protein J4N89_03305 [Chloroflexi bacterium]|nr:hypothetical protein [Chloroflexota bacterium]MCI0781802.1 hypothetical protein [Chloroflexota bacterium]MCI0786340.1 hypothetical protein [Chloroflexota bacterium]MCI0798249.1 hypothetical protein [Chloroflexota bacterium]MCI0865547.1 hypothetical protein [Chloroflexota bacterium]
MVQSHGHNDGIRQDNEKLQRLIALYVAGHTYKNIGSQLGVSDSRVQQIVRREIRDGELTPGRR